MTSPAAKTIADFLIADFEAEIQLTLRVFAAVPEAQLDYRPDAISKTGIGLLRHLAIEDVWLLSCVADGVMSNPPDDSEACGIFTAAEAMAAYRERVPAALNRVRAMSPQQLAATIDVFGRVQIPAVALFAEAIKHSVHHRGQLSSYVRAMGGTVPSIYGPSAAMK